MTYRALLILALLALPARALGEWPAHRHDAQRTATGDGTSDIVRPTVTWRHYLGGSLSSAQVVTYDVDADGAQEVIFISGGALAAKTPRDVRVWRTPILELSRIEGVADLDADGSEEIVVSATSSVHVIALSTGTVLWSLPAGDVGATGAARLADFNRDARLDLYVTDRGCGNQGSVGEAAQVWSFAAGAATPTRLFQLEEGRRDYLCGTNDVVSDIDGDGQLDIVAIGTSAMYVYSGADGSFVSASESLGSIPYGQATFEVANLDGDAALELVGYADNAFAATQNSRRIFMMDWDAGTERLVRRWERSVADIATDRHGFGLGGLADLGANGSLDVVTSFYSASAGTWRTVVLDPATGSERSSFAGGPFRGLADFDGTGGPEVVIGDRTRGVTVLRWNGSGFASVFAVDRFDPLEVRGRDATTPAAIINRVLAFDVNHDGAAELVGVAVGGDGVTPEAIVALSASAEPGTEVARLALNERTSVLAAAVAPALTRDYAQLLVALSDGYLWVLDDVLAPANSPPGVSRLIGMRVGGFFSGASGVGRAPLAADLDADGASEVIVANSRRALLRLGVEQATRIQGPEVDWEIPGVQMPVLAEVDGAPPREVVHWTTATHAALAAAGSTDGAGLWQRTIGSDVATPTNDLLVGDVDGDNKAEIIYSLAWSGLGTRFNVVRAGTGAQAWTSYHDAGSTVGVGSLFARPGQSGDDLLVTARNQLQWIVGTTGVAEPAVAGENASYGLFGNIDDDAAVEIVGAGGAFTVSAYELDLSRHWASERGGHSGAFGVVARCADGARYVGGHVASSRLTAWSAATGEVLDDAAFKAGQRWDSAELAPDGIGRLGNATLSPDLTGSGRSGVLVPSTDGHLYAVDPCNLELLWALPFEGAVGEAILADTDADGKDEIVVTAADGFVYGVDRETFPAPAYVYENSGEALAANATEDVDQIATRGTLSANWAAVDGATAYEYAILSADDSFVTQPDFISVGTATHVTATGLPLVTNETYYFAVRAIGPPGTSAEQLSDGVLVLPHPCEACGPCTVCIDEQCIGTCVHDAGPLVPPGDAGVDTCGGSCGLGTNCRDGLCVGAGRALRQRGGGCCSVAGNEGGDSRGLWLGLGLLALLARRRRGRGAPG